MKLCKGRRPRQYTDFLHRFDRCQVVPRPGGAYNGDISIRRQTRSPPGAAQPADQLHGVVTMESIILYGSRYGATRRYALALSERTGIPACSYRDKPDLSGKTLVVYLGGLYAGGVLGLAKTLRHFSLQPGQTLLIATVGLADPGDPATRANLRASLQRQLPPGLLEQAQVFHLRGGIDYRKLTPAHRAVMGLLYRDGGLVIPDTEKARYWMEAAATQNVPAAQYTLGKLLLSDDALVHDPDQGIRWLKAAAQNGNDYATYALGKEYLTGKYVFKNTAKAADYLHQASQEGNPWAQYLLGKLYLMGDGVEQDENTAYQWFQAAAEQGHVYAEFFVERMEQGWTASPQLMLSTTRLLHHMGNIFRDNTPAPPASGGPHIDRKRLQKLRAKKIALGHKPDDHEEEQQSRGMSMGGW